MKWENFENEIFEDFSNTAASLVQFQSRACCIIETQFRGFI